MAIIQSPIIWEIFHKIEFNVEMAIPEALLKSEFYASCFTLLGNSKSKKRNSMFKTKKIYSILIRNCQALLDLYKLSIFQTSYSEKPHKLLHLTEIPRS